MTAAFEVVRYAPELRGEIIDFQKHLWGPDPIRNAAYFEWKYEKNPFLPEPLIYLARAGGRIVGMRGFFGAQWQGGAETILGLYADDTVIAPEFRGRGVFLGIMNVALDELAGRGHDYVFNLSAGVETFVASLASGWKSIGSMRPAARVRDTSSARRLARTVARRFPVLRRIGRGWVARRASPEWNRWPERFRALDRAGEDGHVLVERAPRPIEMANLIERIGHDGRIRHVRDPEYLTWRFQNPLHEYRFLFVEGRTGLEGYLVLQRRIADVAAPARIQIVDWEATRAGVRQELIKAAVALGKDQDLVTWTATLPEDALEALRRADFIAVEPEATARGYPSVLVRSLRGDYPVTSWAVGDRRLVDLPSWDLRLIYSMSG